MALSIPWLRGEDQPSSDAPHRIPIWWLPPHSAHSMPPIS